MDMISQEKIAFPSFAALGAAILANESLPLKRRKDAGSALASLAKGLGIDPEVLLADPAILRTALKDFTPAMAGLKPSNLRNILSRTRFAMIQAGLITVPGRYSHAPSAAWAALLAGFGEDAKSDYRILSRFGRYCGVIGVEPPQVDESIVGKTSRGPHGTQPDAKSGSQSSRHHRAMEQGGGQPTRLAPTTAHGAE